MKPTLFTIYPYLFKGMWVFDEPRLGLDKEAFVQGADTIIDFIGKEFPSYEDGFTVTFSNEPMYGTTGYILSFIKSENGGSWYHLDRTELQGWLCPALFKFFDVAPNKIYVRASEGCLSDRLGNKLVKIFSRKKPIVQVER